MELLIPDQALYTCNITHPSMNAYINCKILLFSMNILFELPWQELRIIQQSVFFFVPVQALSLCRLRPAAVYKLKERGRGGK